MGEFSPAEERDESDADDPRLSGAALLDAVADGVYQLDREGRFVAVNDSLADLTGHSRSSLVGSHVSRVLDVQDVVGAETAIRELLVGESRDEIRLTCPVFTAGGDTVACEVRASPIRLKGEFRGTVGVVREVDDADAPGIDDVGEHRQAFDALAEASADGIIMLDDDSTVRYANPAVERILGYEPDELVGASKMTIIPERLREVHAEALQRYLETGRKHIDWTYVELPGRHADGHEVPLAVSLNDFEHAGEHYFVGTFRDISDRKAAERELERQNDRLERFASMLAHELRNPLEIARVSVELLDGGDEATREEIADALGRIDEIIDVLLAIARDRELIEGVEAVALAGVAADAWADIETGAATLENDAEAVVRANPSHLRHLLENLFRNAIEHGSTSDGPSDDGDSEPDSADSDDAPVTVRIGDLSDPDPRSDAPVGGFYVEDTGSGIPESQRAAVAEPGFTTDEAGIGLGLTFVAELAAAYGWEWSITESEAGGARFEFVGVGLA
ncbi:PAS domain S-box protein [Halorussus marinus]|uniref:PAS domain S-box protein n=1 Tax=Halorussus marinus TaxID=2505976 RepID=UPI001091B1CA|nr:PAS domain S-box protein [Halorussus marinus]